MRLEEIITRLINLGLPLAENEFRKTKEQPLPEPPYLIWYEEEQEAEGADNAVLLRRRTIVLELYTDKIEDKKLEQRIEREVLYDIGYKKYQAPIESEDLVQTAYNFMITEKLKLEERKNG